MDILELMRMLMEELSKPPERPVRTLYAVTPVFSDPVGVFSDKAEAVIKLREANALHVSNPQEHRYPVIIPCLQYASGCVLVDPNWDVISAMQESEKLCKAV